VSASLTLDRETALLSAPEPATDWRASLRLGYLVLFLTVGIAGGWAALAHIDSAVVVQGSFSVEAYRKTVQHLEGGIVSEILVRDGDRVEEGQTLIRLDTTRFEAGATAASLALANALATEARLVAQRDMVDYVVMPEEVASLVGPGGDRGEIDDNNREFEIRRLVLASSLELLETQIGQARNDVEQAGLDTETARSQLDSVKTELGSVKPLLAKGLVAMSRVTSLERQKVQFESAVSKTRAEAEKARNKIEELRLRMEGMRRDYRQEASKGLVDLAREIARLRQERQVALDMLGRSAIRSPVGGTVQALRVFTVGGVIRSGEPLLDVVPDTDRFVVKGRIPPSDVDRLKKGMDANVNLGALMKYRRETVHGTLTYVSPDAVADANPSLPPAFAVEVTVARDAVPEDIRDRLQAGMEAAVIIPTEGRSVLQYLLAPVLENLDESLRER
jgi:HlyD family type I secretion membrane fusion protein